MAEFNVSTENQLGVWGTRQFLGITDISLVLQLIKDYLSNPDVKTISIVRK